MSALFLLMIPLVALATYRTLTAVGIGSAPAAVGAVLLALVVTLVPAWALRTKPSHGQPLETPVGPGFANTTGRTELLVDYVSGWSRPAQVAGETVRRLSGHGRLAVGPLQATRPRATLSFRMSAPAPTRVTIAIDGRTVRVVRARQKSKLVTVPIPQGTGPAVYDVDVGAGGMIVIPASSVHAVVANA